MFDTSIEFFYPYRTATGKTSVGVRFPSDQQWIERGLLTKIFQKKAGRGALETEVLNNNEFDLKLYNEVKVENAPDLTPQDATRLLDAVVFCEVRDTTLGDDDATVVLGITGGEEVKHRVKIPTAEQVIQFRKKVSRGARELPNGKNEYRIMYEVGAALWDKCAGASSDYANGIPAPHKNAAMRSVIDELDRELQGGGPGGDRDGF